MTSIPIGSITILTNRSDQQLHLFSSDLNEKISGAIVDWVNKELKKQNVTQSVVITGHETKTGCVITIILLGIAIKGVTTAQAVGAGLTVAGLGAAGYKFITDYDKIKKNLKSITTDIKGLWLKITHRKKKDKSRPSEHDIELFEEIPDEFKKYVAAGKEVVIVSETEILTCHKICVVREDVTEEITTEKYEKKIKAIKPK